MDKAYKITIPKPCHENWNEMTPQTNGRFCSSCTKTVVDFTKMNANEIQHYFRENREKNICGHFLKNQVSTFDVQIPRSLLHKRMPFHKAFLLALFIAMGSSLFSCKNHNNDTLGEVCVVDSTKQKRTDEPRTTTGAPLPPKETTIDGNVKVEAKDTIHSKK